MTSIAALERGESRPTWTVWRRAWSLRAALIMFALSVVAPTLLFLGMQYRAAVVDKQLQIERQLRQLSRSVASDIERELLIKRVQVTALATSLALRYGDFDTFRTQAETALRAHTGWLAVLRSDGTQLMHTLVSPGVALPPSRIPRIVARVARTGYPEETDLFASNIGETYVISSIYPVGFGDLVLSTSIPSDHLSKVLRAALPEGWRVGLTDRQGKIVARSHNNEQYAGQAASSEFLQRISAADEGSMRWPTLDGLDSYMDWVRLPNGWTVAVAVPTALIEQPMRTWEREFFLSLLLVVALSAVGVAFGGGAIARSMGLLAARTNRLGSGEVVAPLHTPLREVNDVGEALAQASLDRQRAEGELHEREEQFRTLANSIPQLAWMATADGGIAWFNDRWYEYTGATPQQMEGWGWRSVCDRAGLPEVLARWKRCLATGEPFDSTIALKGADGKVRPFLTRAMALRDGQGRIARWFGTNTDITAQKEHEAHLNFVMRELSHRSKNLLAVIQAMARQTIQHSTSFDDFETRFTGRLHGLARSHDLLVRGDWTGAAIHDLVRAQLAPFVPEEGDCLDIRGPNLVLKPEAVQNLGFALFELATNAVKYGALSVPNGKAIIRWEFIENSEKSLRFVWREIGGPQVQQPERTGFGTMVIERFMSTAFGGSVISDFQLDGFRWTLDIPARHLSTRRPGHDWPWRAARSD